jgi:hypothetical protein
MLTACSDSVIHQLFKTALAQRFEVGSSDWASWYLRACIQQDTNVNITLDQSRYARSIVEQYLPNAPVLPSPEDLECYFPPSLLILPGTRLIALKRMLKKKKWRSNLGCTSSKLPILLVSRATLPMKVYFLPSVNYVTSSRTRATRTSKPRFISFIIFHVTRLEPSASLVTSIHPHSPHSFGTQVTVL